MDFDNDNGKTPFDYDMRSKHSRHWDKETPYQYNKEEILAQLNTFVKNYR